MTPPPRDEERRLRAFPTMDSRRLIGVASIALLLAALGVVMLMTGPVAVQVLGAVLVGGAAYELWRLRAKRRYEAVVVDGHWIGYRRGTRGDVVDWTDLTRVTHVYVERLLPQVRKDYVNVAIWNEREGPFRRDESWGTASRRLRAERGRRRAEGEMAICIPLGAMARADQDAMRAHLAAHGIIVDDPADDAAWPI